MGHLVRILPAESNKISHAVLEAYLSQRLDEHAAKTTVKKEFRTLGSVLRYASRNGAWKGDVSAVIPELEEGYVPRTRVLSFDEAWALLVALEPHRAAHVAFIIATGARWSESVNASMEDVWTDVVHLRGTKTAAARREVPLVTPWQQRLIGMALPHMPFEGWDSVRRDLHRACARCEMQPVSANDLRRTFATWMRVLGVDVSSIAKLLGHTSTRMAERVYAQLSTETLADNIRKAGGTIAGQADYEKDGNTAILTNSRRTKNDGKSSQ